MKAGKGTNTKAVRKKALAFFQKENFAKARELYARLCRANSKDMEAWAMLGSCCERLGDYNEAARCCRQVVELTPNSAEAHFNLAIVLRVQGLLSEAVASYQKAQRLKPDFVEAYVNVAAVCLELGRFRDAVTTLQQALEINPTVPEIYLNLSRVFDAQGKYDEALVSLSKAEEIDPNHGDPAVLKARILQRKGEKKAAYQIVRGHIEGGGRNPAVAIVFANLCREYNCCDEAITLLEQSLAQSELMEIDQRELHFALGKLYDGKQEFNTAFKHFQAANALNPYQFDPQKHAHLINETIAAYSQEDLTNLPHGTNRSECPVFIVGMTRSGTTLVEQIIASHPKVYGAGELPHISDLAEAMPAMVDTEAPHPQSVSKLTQEAVDQMAEGYLEKLAELSADAARVTDKMPHNFLYLGLIELLFPKARVIHCRREPMDTCLSIYTLQFNASHPYADDLTYLGFYYREYQRLMRHWRSVLTIPVLEVCYEELIADQEKITRSILDFCGLDWDERCLRFHESERSVTTLSYDQVRQPLYNKSVGRWKHYEPHLAPLKAALQPEGSEL